MLDIEAIEEKMSQVEELVKSDLATVRTGRATPALIENIQVEAYEGTGKLKIVELATITLQDPHTLVISPWDKSVIGQIRKAIESANIGLSASIDRDLIRIKIPPMTSEDRQNFIKILHQKLENGKIMIRQIRHEAMERIRQSFAKKEISEDEKILDEENLQKLTDKYVEQIEQLGKIKEQQILSI